MSRYANWVLNARGLAVQEPNLMRWAKWMSEFDRRIIARTEIHHCTISTVFLGIDYNHFETGDPILFETMVFQGERESMICGQPIAFDGAADDLASALWGDCRRYSFKCDALEGHKQAVLSIEKQFGQVEDKVSGLIYGIMNAEEWVKDEREG